ncbi:NADPH-dependent oxidoreductase [Bacillus sp. B15-48]|uniref:NADPH-dependent oxidoreductase n=1 Tax=Bacillus sp. B15-48 TaxID=1548601 RepID=UPI00193F51D3|nr:NADPH-dependent oxidoreductase [Bacillus sp. B15-48]MBM4761575.1 NADPH-dependent oxidoreductase [Bacillus sp. B15-48]
MNETINGLKDHRSVREFDSEKEVSEVQVKAIVEAAMAAPNWINGQQVSIIEVRDSDKKATIAKAAGNQRWIEEAPVFLLFCLDFHRAKLAAEKNGASLQVVEDLESVIVGSTDVGIALGTAVVAAESMGFGTVPIGGIRKNPQVLIEMLNLPEYVFPVSGLVVGNPRAIPEQKPRLPLQATFHKEQYNAEVQKELIDEYDETVSSYMAERTQGEDASNWSRKVARFYDTGIDSYKKHTSSTLKQQGFLKRD